MCPLQVLCMASIWHYTQPPGEVTFESTYLGTSLFIRFHLYSSFHSSVHFLPSNTSLLFSAMVRQLAFSQRLALTREIRETVYADRDFTLTG
jgi:hypothetical protein